MRARDWWLVPMAPLFVVALWLNFIGTPPAACLDGQPR